MATDRRKSKRVHIISVLRAIIVIQSFGVCPYLIGGTCWLRATQQIVWLERSGSILRDNVLHAHHCDQGRSFDQKKL